MKLNPFKFTICISLFLLLYGCTDRKEMDCSMLQNGVFKLVSMSNQKEYIITRTSTCQVERNFGTNNDLKFDIKWTSPCDYILFNGRKISGNRKYKTNKTDTIYCRIINVDGNTHEVLTYKYNEVKQHRFKLQKVKVISKRL